MQPIKKHTRQAWNGGPDVNALSVDDDPNLASKLSTSLMDLDDYDNEDGDDIDKWMYDENGDFSGLETYNTYEHIDNGTMTDEEAKLEGLRQAVNVAKLFTNVTVGDVLKIALKLASYFKNYNISKK